MKNTRPWLPLAIAAAIVTLTLALVLLVSGRSPGPATAGAQVTREAQSVAVQASRLEVENRELKDAVARAERTLRLDQTAYRDLKRTLQASSQEVARLREELSLYRNIIAPADRKPGLRIHQAGITRTTKGGRYHMILVQAMRHESDRRGQISLTLVGYPENKEAQSPAPIRERYDLRYFQEFSGPVAVPAGFVPRGVKVTVTPDDRRGRPLETTVSWPK